MDKRGKFIVIDGMDGSGKGTQIKLLKEKLEGHSVLFTREPGGTPKAEEIREMLLRQGGPVSNPVSDFFLFWASRGSHVEDFVAPSLQAGIHVISDRYDSSTFAFQLWGERHHDQWLASMFDAVRSALPKSYIPDAYIFLDLPPEVAFERRSKDAAQEKSRFDVRPLSYHQNVRAGFHEFKNRYGAHLVDAHQSPEQVHAALWSVVAKELAL